MKELGLGKQSFRLLGLETPIWSLINEVKQALTVLKKIFEIKDELENFILLKSEYQYLLYR